MSNRRINNSIRPKELQRSGNFHDEITQTLIDSSEGRIPLEELDMKLNDAINTAELEGEAFQQAELDVQISLRKRFPGHYKEFEESVPND